MIFDAVATVQDAISSVELIHAPLYTLSLDFTEAFDRSRIFTYFGCQRVKDIA